MVAQEIIQNYYSKTSLMRIFFFNEKQEVPLQDGNIEGSCTCLLLRKYSVYGYAWKTILERNPDWQSQSYISGKREKPTLKQVGEAINPTARPETHSWEGTHNSCLSLRSEEFGPHMWCPNL